MNILIIILTVLTITQTILIFLYKNLSSKQAHLIEEQNIFIAKQNKILKEIAEKKSE